MPIIPIPVRDALLHRIWETRPLLKLKEDVNPEQARESANDTSASLGLAQRVFVVGLDALSGEKDATGSAVGLRIYETVDGLPRAFYDVDEADDGAVRQMSTAARHLEPLAGALDIAARLSEQDERNCELRLYRVPALNFEALWLSYDDIQVDTLVPLTAVGPLPAGEPVRFVDAVAALREAARPLLQMDDTMGA